MAKLCRIYLHGLGNPKARFHDLTLDFCNDQREPSDSVLFLRNGGGKTSLISLFYSVFLPDRGDFLGRRNNKKRLFDDYVITGQSGLILVELAFPAHGGHRRIFGLHALRRERDTEARRVFFSFRADAVVGTGWDDLPERAEASIDGLFRRVKACDQAHRQKVDFFETENQSRWREHLELVNFDPAVLRHHLKMNAEEGGVVDLFKHSDAKEFARLFLELTLDPESFYSTDEQTKGQDMVQVQMAAFRGKVAREPATRAIAVFCEAVQGPLGLMREHIRRRDRMRLELQSVEREVGEAARSLNAHIDGLEQAKATAETAKEELAIQKEAAETEVKHCTSWRRTTDYLTIKLQHAEATAKVEECAVAEAAVVATSRLYAAAKLYRDIETNEARRRELQAEIERAESERAPFREELRGIGSQLHRALDMARGEAEAKEQKLLQNRNELRGRVAELAKQIGESEQQRAGWEATARHLRGRIEESRTKIAALRTEGVLRADESAHEAMSRHGNEIQRLDLLLASLRQDVADAVQEEAGAMAEKSRIAIELASQTKEHTERERELRGFDTDWAQLAERVPLRTAAAGAVLNPWNSSLAASLQDGLHQRKQDLIRFVLGAETDRRLLEHYRDGGVFPAPADVGQVIGQLRNLGIRNAQPLYEYLAQALPAAEAEPRLRAQPAAYSGVLLQNDADFQRAARELRAAPCERPVVLVSRAFLQQPTANLADTLAVVLPREAGLWNSEQAAKDAPALRERVEQASRRRAEIDSEIGEWSDAGSALRDLTRRFAEGRVSALRENVRTLATALEDLRASAGRAEEDLKGAKSRRAHAEGEAQKATSAKQAATVKRQHVEQGWQTYEQPRPEWERQISALDEQVETAMRNCAEMGLEKEDLARKAEGLDPLIKAEQQGATLWAERIAQLPADYYDATAKPRLEHTLDALTELFATKRAVFEKRFSASAASGQLVELSKVNATLRAEFRTASAGLDRVEIECMAIEDRLPALIEQSNVELVESKAAHKSAEQRAQDLRNRLSGAKRYTELPEGRREPETVAEVEAMGREFRDKQEEALARTKDLGEKLHAQDMRISELGGIIPRYVSMLQSLEQARVRSDEEGARHPGFTGAVDQDQALIVGLAGQRTRLRRDIDKESEAVREVFQERVHARAAQMAKDDRPAILDKYLAFSLGDVEQKIDERIHEIGQALEAARGELASIEQDRTIIVAQLDQRASVAERRLSDLERASKMPAGIEAWAGCPFISVCVFAAHDTTERR
jgi:DNA repair exonuclease SbcCD ATPase subunit